MVRLERKLAYKPADEDYGLEAAQPDLTKEEYEEEFHKFYTTLPKTVEEKRKILEKTIE